LVNSKSEFLKHFTLNGIKDWAGATITSRGQNYQLEDRVRELAFTPDGGLVAWVRGTERYATVVDVVNGRLISDCTCPYDGTCKHAVAVLLEYQAQISLETKIPVADEADRRLALLEEDAEEYSEEGDEDWEEDDEEEELAPSPIKTPRNKSSDTLHSYLESQNKEQLIALLEYLSVRYPDVREVLQDKFHLAEGKVTGLVNAARREIEKVSAEPGWSSHWDHESSIPDYSGVRNRLEMLLANGYADEVLSLGKTFLEAGISQVEQSDDEGETAEEIAQCMDVVFTALSGSSLPPVEQMLWVIEMELSDDYELCRGTEEFWGNPHQTADWSLMADKLIERLNSTRVSSKDEGYSRDYRRDRLSGWVIMALENSGRQDEIIPLCEREAEKTRSYIRLVRQLLSAGRREEAELWIRKGISATQKQLPGIARELHDILREMREHGGDWFSVAAFRADDFFSRPSQGTFTELQKAAGVAGVGPAVRLAAMRFLETGDLPGKTATSAIGVAITAWPLPDTRVSESVEIERRDFPLIGTLIDIAIEETQPYEVIRWYNYAAAHRVTWSFSDEENIADAVAEKYPERSIAIWKKLAENLIAQTQTRAYERAAGYLTNVRLVLRGLKREDEWQKYLAALRQANIRKRRFIEIINALAKK
jgi:uncharacterized Zn finger protein